MVTLKGLDQAFTLVTKNGIRRPKGLEPAAVMRTWGKTFQGYSDEELLKMVQLWLEESSKGFWPQAPEVMKKNYIFFGAKTKLPDPLDCETCHDTGITDALLVQNKNGEFEDKRIGCPDCDRQADVDMDWGTAVGLGYNLMQV